MSPRQRMDPFDPHPGTFFVIFTRINWKYFVYDIICVIKSSGPNYEEIPAALHYAPLAGLKNTSVFICTL